MSIQAVAWALDQDLPARPKLVLVSIANHANYTDGMCWLKAETIAQEASCTPRAVYRFVADLIRNGYIRKQPKRGADGRQRANDYWILINRPDAPWVSTPAQEEAVEIEDEAETIEADAQDVVEPTDTVSCGESPLPDDSGVSPPTDELSAQSPGPTDSGVSHSESAEPSKSKPKEDARARAFRPRTYQPPPPPKPQPLAEVSGRNAKEFFVFKPSKAYRAWAIHMSLKNRLGLYPNGEPRWQLETTKFVDGQTRRGWYFPSLFPPETGDPPSGNQSEDSAA